MRVTASPSALSTPGASAVRTRRGSDPLSPATIVSDVRGSGFTGAPLRIGRVSCPGGSSRSSRLSISAIAYPRADSPHGEDGSEVDLSMLYTSEDLLVTSPDGSEKIFTANFATTTNPIPEAHWGREDEPAANEAAAAAEAPAEEVQEHVWVHFELQYECKFGQGLYLVGEGDESLGGWTTGMPMKWSEGENGRHIWSSQLLLPSGHSISYKYVVRSFDDLQGKRAIQWQPGENRQLAIPKVITGDGQLAHQATIATSGASSITFRVSKDSLVVHDQWVGDQMLSWGRVRQDLVEEMAVELERHNVVEMPSSPGEGPSSSPPPSPQGVDAHAVAVEVDEEMEAALQSHIEEYEETNDLLEELADLVQDVQSVYHCHGKTSFESFTVDRAVAAAVDAALFLVQKQHNTLIGDGGGSVRPPSALPDGSPRP